MVSVTDNWAKVEAKMFRIEFGSLVTIKKIAYLNQAINNNIFTFVWLLLQALSVSILPLVCVLSRGFGV